MLKIKVKNIIPEYRLNCKKAFEELGYLTEEQIEKLDLSIYNYMVEFCNLNNIKLSNPISQKIYMNKFIHIITNIDNKSYIKNEYLYKKIISGEIDVENLVNLEAKDMAPDKWEYYNSIEKTKVSAIIHGGSMAHRTTLYVCSRCKKNDTEYIEQQSRSADEPTSFYITCRNCGKKWIQ